MPMTNVFILPPNFLPKLLSIAQEYQQRNHVSLDRAAPYSISLYFGAKNTSQRQKQIDFLTQWIIFLTEQEPIIDNFENTHEVVDHYYFYLKIIVSVSLFLRNQMSRKSSFKQLLEEALGLDKHKMDEATRATCLMAARFFLEKSSQFLLTTPLFDREMICSFGQYIDTECNAIAEKEKKNFSFTQLTVPFFSYTFQGTGQFTGYVLGDLLRNKTRISRVVSIATLCGSGLAMLLSGYSGLGFMLIAPAYLSQLEEYFPKLTLAYLLGAGMRIVGNKVGWGTGVSLDLAWQILSQSCLNLLQLCQKRSACIDSGFRLLDSKPVINGTVIDFDSSANHRYYPMQLSIESDGVKLAVDGAENLIGWKQPDNEPDDENNHTLSLVPF